MAHVMRRPFCMPQAGKTGQVISGTEQKTKNIRLADNQTSDREPFRFPFKTKTKGRELCSLSVRKRQLRALSKRVTRKKDISKSRKLCLLSVQIRRFAGRYEPRLIGRQAFGSRLCKAFCFAGGKRNFFLYR